MVSMLIGFISSVLASRIRLDPHLLKTNLIALVAYFHRINEQCISNLEPISTRGYPLVYYNMTYILNSNDTGYVVPPPYSPTSIN